MDVIDIARTVLRRWYVVVPVLMVTAGLAYAIVSTAEAEYETTGSFLLADASLVAASGGSGGTGGAVSPLVIAEIVQGDDVRRAVTERGGAADYEVSTGPEEGLLRIQATGDAQQPTANTVQLVIEEIDRVLAERQEAANVPEQRRATLEVLASASTAQQESVLTPEGDEELRYVANGTVRLLGIGQGANPYAASYTGTIRVLEEVMRSPQVRRDIAEAGARGTYEVAMQQRDTAPIIYVTGTATSPEASMETFSITLERLRAELQSRQETAGAPPASFLTLEPLSLPSQPVLVGGELRRPLIVIVGLGLLAAVSLAVLVEGLSARSRRSRRDAGFVDSRSGAMPPDGHANETAPVSQSVRGA